MTLPMFIFVIALMAIWDNHSPSSVEKDSPDSCSNVSLTLLNAS